MGREWGLAYVCHQSRSLGVKHTVWVLPHIDCFSGVEDEFSIEKTSDPPGCLFGFVWSGAF